MRTLCRLVQYPQMLPCTCVTVSGMVRLRMLVQYRQYCSIVVRPCGNTMSENVVLLLMAYEPRYFTPLGTV